MEKDSSRIRPGLALRDSEIDAAASVYLKGRLRIFFFVLFGTVTGMYVLGHLIHVIAGTWSLDVVVAAHAIVHLVSCVAAGGILLLLLFHECTGRQLRGLDTMGLYLALGTGVAIYGLMYEQGYHLLVGQIAVFIVARAVVIPSTARWTFLVSLPGAIGVLIVQLAHDTDYMINGEEVATRAAFTISVLWNQVTILFGIAVATVASRVNFALRTEAVEAKQFGRYRLDEKLGQGGMGEVYRATHAMLRRPTAIKLLRPDLTGEEMIKRFHLEVRETSRLSNPHTVRIFDYGQTAEGLFYYAMEYLDGADLLKIVEKTGPMPASRTIYLLRQVCRSLAEAHGVGLVHRDLKPGNIMTCRLGGELDVAKVLDFGLVKDLSNTDLSLTQVGAICGTPETLAPEVINGERASPAADIYALGVVAYFMATGKPVFSGNGPLALIRHHLDTAPVPPSEVEGSVPGDLEAIILTCLSKDPERRFSSVTAMREALEDCADAHIWTEDQAREWWGSFSRTPESP
jgi:eukaryotic-like serine/threonine-protein kinase